VLGLRVCLENSFSARSSGRLFLSLVVALQEFFVRFLDSISILSPSLQNKRFEEALDVRMYVVNILNDSKQVTNIVLQVLLKRKV